jgi:hypothetical protein
MVARIDAISLVSILKITSEFFRKISALASLDGGSLMSGASAWQMAAALRLDVVDTLILALQLFKFNIICP